MTPHKAKGKRIFRVRVSDYAGRTAIRSCGTDDQATADDMGHLLHRLLHRRGNAANGVLLAALIDRRVTVRDLYDADMRGPFAAAGDLAALAAALEREALPAERDLSPLVKEWNGRGSRGAQSPKYVRQVRRFIPEDRAFPLSKFRRGEIAAFLEGLTVDEPTRNRYKAALSQFGAWLVRHEHLDTNPVRDAGTFSEHTPRLIHLEPAQAKALVAALSGEAQFVAALMAGTGVEWQAVERARARDLDLDARTFHAHGGKTKWRDRVVEITEAWTLPFLRAHLRTLTSNAPLVTIKEYQALHLQKLACAALGLPAHHLHDWRHTYAVTALKRGDDPQDVKRQLGHAANSILLHTTYGVWIAEARRHQEKEAKRAGRGR